MNLAIVLGNGFDINLGLNTSYSDFCKDFLESNKTKRNVFEPTALSEHVLLARLLYDYMEVSDWADLEMIIGNSLDCFGNVRTLSEEKVYLEEQLDRYLKKEQDRLRIVDSNELKRRMDITIRRFLNNDEQNQLDQIVVQFVTFNYTHTIDEIIEKINEVSGVDLGSENRFSISYKKPLHIHGEVGKTVIFGVNDESQYGGKVLKANSSELKRIMLKPVLNKETRELESSRIRDAILESDRVIVYGSSIGQTDNLWWGIIARWILTPNSSRHLTICSYMPGMNSVSATAQARIATVGDRFDEVLNSVARATTINDTSGRNNYKAKVEEAHSRIEVRKCEEWMFSFSGEGTHEPILIDFCS